MLKIFCDEWRPLRRNEEQVSTLGTQDAKGEIVRMDTELIIQEDVDILGISILSGAHMTVVPSVLDLLKEQEADDIIVVAGGVIPDEDVKALTELGVQQILLQDTPPDVIVSAMRRLVDERPPR